MARHSSNGTVGNGFAPRTILRRIGAALIGARTRAIMSIGIVLGLGAVGTLAAWSDTSSATSGAFTTGTIDIKVGDPAVDNNPTTFATTLTKTDILPGQTVSAPLQVTNSGTVGFTYTIAASTNNGTLGALLNTAVYAGAACTGTPLSTITGLTVAPQNFQSSSVALSRPIGVGDPADNLCFSVTMPSTATSPATPITGTVTYSLAATSV